MTDRRNVLYVLLALIQIAALLLSVTVKGEQEEQMQDSLLFAKAAVLMDGNSGRVLYSKNGDASLPMASTTKIMTCIVALEYGNEQDTVTVTNYAAAQPPVRLGLKAGQKILLKHLLYSMMLESHNDSAAAIAEHIGGSVESFASMMNEKAKEIGCQDTYFITPNGLDAQDGQGVHHTTAKDLARILSYCLNESSKAERFRQITAEKVYSFEGHTCNNHNALLEMIQGACSGKTGFTCDAGYCYTGAVERDGKCLVVALLACGWPNNKGYKWRDCKKLFDYGFRTFEVMDLKEQMMEKQKIKEKLLVTESDVEITGNSEVGLVVNMKTVKGKTKVLGKTGEKAEIKLEYETQKKAPVKTGEAVGTMVCLLDGTEYCRADIETLGEAKKMTYFSVVEKFMDKVLNFQIMRK